MTDRIPSRRTPAGGADVRRPRVRHAVLAAALAVVAALRAADADWVWAGVFGAGVLVELFLLRQDRCADPSPRYDGSAGPPAHDELDVARKRHARTTRMWTVLLVVSLVVALALLTTDAALAAVVGVVAVAALLLRRRSALTTARLDVLRARDR